MCLAPSHKGSITVRYPTPLISGTLLGRRQRYLCDVRLPTGEEVVAHCANPGRMTTALENGAPVRLSYSPKPTRKLDYSVEQIQIGGIWVAVYPARANAVIEEGVREGRLPSLSGFEEVLRERLDEHTRTDLLLRRSESPERMWVEVKSVTLRHGTVGLFPDAPSARGARHMNALSAAVRAGDRATVVFWVARGDVESVSPAEDIDAAYASALRNAARAGVEVIAWRARVTEDGLGLDRSLPVAL